MNFVFTEFVSYYMNTIYEKDFSYYMILRKIWKNFRNANTIYNWQWWIIKFQGWVAKSLSATLCEWAMCCSVLPLLNIFVCDGVWSLSQNWVFYWETWEFGYKFKTFLGKGWKYAKKVRKLKWKFLYDINFWIIFI